MTHNVQLRGLFVKLVSQEIQALRLTIQNRGRRRRLSGSAECFVDNFYDGFRFRWFYDDLPHTEHARDRASLPFMVGRSVENHRSPRDCRSGTDLLDELIAIHPWHYQVCDDKIGMLPFGQLQALRAIFGFQQTMARVTQESRDQLAV